MFYRKRDYSYRDKDFRDRSTPRSRKDLTRTSSKVFIEPEFREMFLSGEERLSEESIPSENLKPNKVGKKSNEEKEGRIYCVCAFQSYETLMLLCSKCKSYSHADCYEVFDLNIEHICGSCAIKKNLNCTNNKIKIFMEKQNKTQKEHSNFAFNLMLRRAMNSILKEDFKSTQPGNMSAEFMRIRFNMSSSYANKMMVHLVQNGYITFFGGFQVDKKRIKNFLYPNGETAIINTVDVGEKVEAAKNGRISEELFMEDDDFLWEDQEYQHVAKESPIVDQESQIFGKELSNGDQESHTANINPIPLVKLLNSENQDSGPVIKELSIADNDSHTGLKNSCSLIEISDSEEQEEDVLEVGKNPILTKSQVIEQASGSQSQPNVNTSASNREDLEDDDLNNDNEPARGQKYLNTDLRSSCTMCSKKFSSESGLKHHLDQHKNKNKFFCEQCRDFCPLASGKIHGVFPCKDCGMKFKRELSLTHHQQNRVECFNMRQKDIRHI